MSSASIAAFTYSLNEDQYALLELDDWERAFADDAAEEITSDSSDDDLHALAAAEYAAVLTVFEGSGMGPAYDDFEIFSLLVGIRSDLRGRGW